jgi:hypothetical protein
MVNKKGEPANGSPSAVQILKWLRFLRRRRRSRLVFINNSDVSMA